MCICDTGAELLKQKLQPLTTTHSYILFLQVLAAAAAAAEVHEAPIVFCNFICISMMINYESITVLQSFPCVFCPECIVCVGGISLYKLLMLKKR